MELPPLKQCTGLFGLVLLLSMILVLFQYHLKGKVNTQIRSLAYDLDKRIFSNDLRNLCTGSAVIELTPSMNPSLRINQTGSSNDSSILKHKEAKDVHNVVFIKGHRSAGTTIQNIIFRFAMKKNLNVLIHNTSDQINESDSKIDKTKVVPAPHGQNYNVLGSRVIFDKDVLSKLFPNSTVYIGIVRHPLYQTASALYYYSQHHSTSNYKVAFRASPRNPLGAFINRHSLFDLELPNKSVTNNRQAVDLGFPVTSSFENDITNKSKVSKFVEDVDKTFHLILIAEKFDESLVLLRRLLGWSMEDILYIKLKVNEKNDHLSDVSGLTDEVLTTHRSWSPVDYTLYDHFKTKLQTMIMKQGDDFTQELNTFRIVQTRVVQFCRSAANSLNVKLAVKPNLWSSGFCVTRELCDVMKKEEHEMTDRVRKRQIEKLK